MFKKILIANRGEIAVRVIRACLDLGISPVAIYSETDRGALHVRLAEEAQFIGNSPASESYLSIEAVLGAARAAEVEAIHPGYGFLSENPSFARACEDAGFRFIGPSPAALALMGDKIASRKAVAQAGVPVIPGTADAVQSVEEAVSAAAEIGYPVMVKASSGGGGKGLRLASSEQDLRSVYGMARSEAESSFGDATIFLEKYLQQPRHIEIQVLGDLYGNLVHLGERECSIQRRHQKLVEEAPSPAVDEDFRQELGAAALSVARAAEYHNAGTVEFLVESSGAERSFYFLEMNTRLQVEHPVTEMVTGIDLVREQIRIAAGEELSYLQGDVRLEGSAIECRIYAEDSMNDFLPSPGPILGLLEPGGPGIRNDSGVCLGSEVPVHYDPLISKLIAFGKDRRQATTRMLRALREYRIVGVKTTIPFFQALLGGPEFRQGHLHTGLIESLLERTQESPDPDELFPIIAAVLEFHARSRSQTAERSHSGSRWKYHGRIPAPFPGP